MSNFDVDSFLFGDIEPQDDDGKKKNTEEENNIDEQEDVDIPDTEVEDEYESKDDRKEGDGKVLPIFQEETKHQSAGEKLLTAQETSQSLEMETEREDSEEKLTQPSESDVQNKPEFPEWTDVNKSVQSREDIIKGIDFSGEVYTGKTKSGQPDKKHHVDTVEVKETLQSQTPDNFDESETPEIPETLPEQQDTSIDQQPDVEKHTATQTDGEIPQQEPQPQISTPSQQQTETLSVDEGTTSQDRHEATTPQDTQKTSVETTTESTINTRKKSSSLKFFFYLVLVIIISLALIFVYLNRDSIPIFEDDATVVNSKNHSGRQIEKEEQIEENRSIEVENNLDKAISKLINGHYRVLDSGGIVVDYIEVSDGEEHKDNIKLDLGDETDPTYLHEGKIKYFNPGEGKEIAWDSEGAKYVMSEENKTYFVVDKHSDQYYRNFVGQHILQDLIDDYTNNKNVVNKVDENTWSWNWIFYTPINNYTHKKPLNAEIILDPEDNYIDRIVLKQDEQKFDFKFDFHELDEPYDEDYIPSNYGLVSEEDFEV